MNRQGPGKIEYVDWTWNPATGCRHNCNYCYAARIAKRFEGSKAFPVGFEPVFHPERLWEPARLAKPARIFVCDMADLFGNWQWLVNGNISEYETSDMVIRSVLRVVKTLSRRHIFLFLTKNPARYAEFEWPNNCWCGASSTGADFAQRCQEMVMYCDANVRFISLEPCLGPPKFPMPGDDRIDWVIMGAQTGPGAPPMRPDWVRDMRDWCQDNGKKFWFKSWGNFIPSYDAGYGAEEKDQYGRTFGEVWVKSVAIEDGTHMVNVGKKRAGRLLDGREWSELPDSHS